MAPAMSQRRGAAATAAAAASAAAMGALLTSRSAAFAPSVGVSPRAATLRGAVTGQQQASLAQDGAFQSSALSSTTGFLAAGVACLAAGSISRASAARGRCEAGVTAVRAFENELGATAPFNKPYWDPLGMAADGDKDAFLRRRQAEIKNGRVAMAACMGWIAPEYFRWEGYISPSKGIKFTDVPNGMAALYKIPAEGWAQMGVFVAFLELHPMRQQAGRAPGDFPGFGWLGHPGAGHIEDPAKKERALNSEINNGRLAMVAITGMVFQNAVTGTTGPDMWGLGAFENELGVQAPVGFWDPLGLAASGDADDFRRRRGVELKHGRISMLACIGYIVPEYFKWPGFASPAQELRFADIPNGLGALTKLPFEGWLQMVLFVGHYEGQFFRQDPNRAPGDFENYGYFGIGKNFIFNFEPLKIEDEETRKKKLNIEIANGRLAMVAIMAMFFQNGTVGSTSAEMWLPSASAFENELGSTAPFKYWDPLKMSADGDKETFMRRRQAEIKNGRVAMAACMGWIAPEYLRWEGFVSPSKGIKFADIPNGMAALYKLPAEGWAQMGVFVAFLELHPMRQQAGRAPGDFPGFGWLGHPGAGHIEDAAKKERALNSEINNGRLAMIAITGMVFQNAVTGSTGPEMWGLGA